MTIYALDTVEKRVFFYIRSISMEMKNITVSHWIDDGMLIFNIAIDKKRLMTLNFEEIESFGASFLFENKEKWSKEWMIWWPVT